MEAHLLRFGVAAVVVGALAACASTPAEPRAAPTSPPPGPTAPVSVGTPTPFLPRGFTGLPGTLIPVATSPTRPDNPTPSPTQAPALDLAAVADRLNRLRANEGLAPLVRTEGLDRIAHERAVELAASRSLWHALDDAGRVPAEEEMASAGFSGDAAELVLSLRIDQEDPIGGILQALLTDAPHRGLVLGAGYRLIGLGLAQDEASWFVVQLLAEDGPID